MKDVAELVEHLLVSRLRGQGLEREAFLSPDYDAHTHDPFLLPDMQKAVGRLVKAIESKEKVAIYADFDADGIPAAVIMHDFLKRVGHEDFEVYIPHRHNEGYGFHPEAVERLAGKGVSLIITVDVGTTGHAAVDAANEKGVDVIITDHHEVSETLPNAHAVVNPKRKDSAYPCSDLCGSAVAFKVVQAVLRRGNEVSAPWVKNIPDGWEKWLLDMVALATVSDMVPLINENRVLTKFGLVVLQKSQRKGIKALCKKHRITQAHISEEDIGFVFAPRINAASRMDEPELAFRLLTTMDAHEAEGLVNTLEKLNSQRKGVVAHIVKSAREKVEKRPHKNSVAVVGDPTWKPALLGLAANSVLTQRGGMVCLWGRDGKGVLKGSCRSDGSVSVVQLFSKAGVLTEAGGHRCAGGFSVSSEHIHSLEETFTSALSKIEEKEGVSVQGPDVVHVPLSLLTLDTVSALRTLAPFGIGNEKPLFEVEAVVSELVVFGKENVHTELRLQMPEGKTLRAFEFYKTPDDFSFTPIPNNPIRVLGSLEKDIFKGGRTCALRIHDILPPLV